VSDYAEFLDSKSIVHANVGRDVPPEAIHPVLYDFQRDIVRWSLRKGRSAVFADCGLGKSLIQLEWARRVGGRILILAPLSVGEQTVREGAKIGVPVNRIRRPEDIIDGVNISNYEMVEHFVGTPINGMVLDECFAKGTPIDTPSGSVYIEDVRPGDKIRNAAGVDTVIATKRREVDHAVKVRIQGRDIICSVHHPWLTREGWTRAIHLRAGTEIVGTSEAMRVVQGDVPRQVRPGSEASLLREILLREMAHESAGDRGASAYERGARKDWSQGVTVASVYAKRQTQRPSVRRNQANADAGGERKGVQYSPPHGTSSSVDRRQWTRIDGAATNSVEGSGRRVGNGVPGWCETAEIRSSRMPLHRHRESGEKDRRGGRRSYTLPRQGERVRRTENDVPLRSWVESVEILESGHPVLERLRAPDGKLYLYDIQAARHPSFSVDGNLVHNSSILKSIDGATRGILLDNFGSVPWKMCCTATPCPNDISELANHCEFLGIMSREEMLASFFVHDDEGWRLRGHARDPFYRWLASWAMALKSPTDLGYDGSRFVLPPLSIEDVVVPTTWRRDGELFPGALKGITDRSSVRKKSAADRVSVAARLANECDGQVIVWCGLNEESTLATEAIDGSVEVCGNQTIDDKIERLNGFVNGRHRVLVTKPKVAGFGLNLQNAATMIFLGLGDSFESYYQCIRRSWRYGQKRPVRAIVVVTDHETEIVANVRRKETQANEMSASMIAAAREYEMQELGNDHGETERIDRAKHHGKGWALWQGDCVQEMREHVDADSIDLSVYSPPFISLYTYSATNRDVGNSRDEVTFFGHFGFVIAELLRVTKPGRISACHVSQVPALLQRDGYIGMKDFRGKTIEAFERGGFVYHGEVCIDKDPQAQAIRTHSKGLLFTQLRKDASWIRPAMADYILVFRKPGEPADPIKPELTNDEWIEWARPIWYGIRESNTLNVAEARGAEDDRHICPLALGTIERVVRLWSNPGETVLSPFAGIGSEGYVSLKFGRKFVGCELKPLYCRTAARNLDTASKEVNAPDLFSQAAR